MAGPQPVAHALLRHLGGVRLGVGVPLDATPRFHYNRAQLNGERWPSG